ncbi:hypothetical protein BS47DRAFT_1368950 [Hydnum rufescens UP504]|uniref:Uncharacterized protein n=1 Tax=Hydnum rufescens UP504 TaxID=1448309 RepID=A0A9P6AFF5_9AGAM|nr:hypothetical protein BS47DRAFT_1368950 [Hydnum rufescens UP504]
MSKAIQKCIADRKKKRPGSKLVEEKVCLTEEAPAQGELFFPAEWMHRDHMLESTASTFSWRKGCQQGVHMDDMLFLQDPQILHYPHWILQHLPIDPIPATHPQKIVIQSLTLASDSNGKINLSSSHSFIRRSMVDNESDNDMMAVDKELGLPDPDPEAEAEAGADLNVGSRDIRGVHGRENYSRTESKSVI